jgi:hypothetical protein
MSEELTDKEVFQQAIDDDPDALPGEQHDDLPPADEPPELTFDHQPTSEDSDEYWRGFAESKGWKDADEVDPAEFKGFKAFVRDHGRIQEARKGEASQKKLDQVIKSTAEIARQVLKRLASNWLRLRAQRLQQIKHLKIKSRQYSLTSEQITRK